MEPWQEQKHCRNCESPLTGSYCHQCGERVLTERDRSLSMMLGAFLQGILNFDNKFFRTFKTLVTRPGELTLAYHRGARQRFLRPVQLFLIANLLYFIFPVLSSLNVSFKTQMYHLPFSAWVRPKLEGYLADRQLDALEFERQFDRQSPQIAKLIVVVLVPMYGLLFRLLYWKRRDYFLTDFFALAFYFLSFYMLVLLVLIPGAVYSILQLFDLPVTYFWGEVVYGLFSVFVLGAFLFLALQRLFGPPRRGHIIRAFLVILLFIPFLQLFRFLLLLVTLTLLV